MKQIRLSEQDAKAHMQALGDLATARYSLGKVVQRILALHGVDPQTPHQFDGDVLTIPSEEDSHDS